jgi:hypothetical protein
LIYIVWAKGTDLVKLGYTADPTINVRLSALQVGCPFPLEVIAFAQGTEKDEREYHWMLSKSAVRGEWFRWGPTAHKIAEMLKAQPPEPKLKAKARNPHRRLGAALSMSYG